MPPKDLFRADDARQLAPDNGEAVAFLPLFPLSRIG
jgi:hypothetical protein